MKILHPFRRWRAALAQWRINRMTARAADLSDDRAYGLVFLYDQGVIRARATGQSITRIEGQVENLTRRKLRVVIEPGTYFVARGNYQNMATTDRYEFVLEPCGSRGVSIAATCINAGLPVPDGASRFRGVKRLPDDLTRFLEASRGVDAMTIQAGVWTLTDRYSAADVQTHLVARDRDGRMRQAVSDENIAQARRILDELGIRHRL